MKLNQAYKTLKKNPRRIENIMKSTEISTKVLPNKTVQPSTGTGPVYDAVKGRKGYRVPGRSENLVRIALSKAKGIAKNPKVVVPAAVIGAAVGVHKKQEAMKKQAAEKITVGGKTYRKGTVGSATKKMAVGGGLVGAALGAKLLGAPGAAIGAAQGALSGGLTGLSYGALRGGLRSGRDELSASGKKWDDLKKRALEKKAERKHTAASGAALAGAGVAGYGAGKAAAQALQGEKYSRKMGKQIADGYVHADTGRVVRKGIDRGIKKNIVRAGKLGAAAAGLGAASRLLQKKAADLHILKDGRKVREGTVGSATTKMGITGAVIKALTHGKSSIKDAVKGVATTAGKTSLVGAGYGAVRGANRIRNGELSMSPAELRAAKRGLKKQAETVHKDGKKYQEGTATSAATKMALAGGLSTAATMGAVKGIANRTAKKAKLDGVRQIAKQVGNSITAKNIAKKTALGAGIYGAYGAAYGALRKANRDRKGITQVTSSEMKKIKEA